MGAEGDGPASRTSRALARWVASSVGDSIVGSDGGVEAGAGRGWPWHRGRCRIDASWWLCDATQKCPIDTLPTSFPRFSATDLRECKLHVIIDIFNRFAKSPHPSGIYPSSRRSRRPTVAQRSAPRHTNLHRLGGGAIALRPASSCQPSRAVGHPRRASSSRARGCGRLPSAGDARVARMARRRG